MDTLPIAVGETIERVCARLGHRPRLARLFRLCYPNTLATTTELLPDGTTYVFTGDIPAMWLRDSTAQVRVYVPRAGRDADLQRVIDLLLAGSLEVCVDDRILGDYADVLQCPELRLDQRDAAEVLELIRGRGHLVPADALALALPGPADLPFLEVAAAAGALLTTGSVRHYPARARGGVVVLTPAELLALTRAAE